MALSTGSLLTAGGLLAPVSHGKPFAANYEEIRVTGREGKEERTCRRGRLSIDAEGRIREDWPEDHLATILDPVLGRSLFLDTKKGRILTEIPFANTEAAVTPAASAACPTPLAQHLSGGSGQSEGLGERAIEGLRCRGVRLVGESGSREFWLSEELGQVVEAKHESGDMQMTYRLFDIRLGDPAPSLFVFERRRGFWARILGR